MKPLYAILLLAGMGMSGCAADHPCAAVAHDALPSTQVTTAGNETAARLERIALCSDGEYLDGLDWRETYSPNSAWLVRCKDISTGRIRNYLLHIQDAK